MHWIDRTFSNQEGPCQHHIRARVAHAEDEMWLNIKKKPSGLSPVTTIDQMKRVFCWTMLCGDVDALYQQLQAAID